MARHERLSERFAGFELCGGARWAEQKSGVGREAIGHSGAQRHLGPDDAEIDSFGVRDSGEIVRARQVYWNCSRERGNPGIPGRAHKSGWFRILEQPGHQRVFPGPAANHQNSHFCNGLGVESEE
jgi:hypothetical protein